MLYNFFNNRFSIVIFLMATKLNKPWVWCLTHSYECYWGRRLSPSSSVGEPAPGKSLSTSGCARCCWMHANPTWGISVRQFPQHPHIKDANLYSMPPLSPGGNIIRQCFIVKYSIYWHPSKMDNWSCYALYLHRHKIWLVICHIQPIKLQLNRSITVYYMPNLMSMWGGGVR